MRPPRRPRTRRPTGTPPARRWSRRTFLGATATGLAGGLSGCLSGPSFPDADVIAGPDGRNVFEPAELTVSVGERVTWGFTSAGHNVCCRPADSDDAALPDGAEEFASYGPDESPTGSVVPRGGSYEHDFTVAGRYDYVCVPHEDVGMTGTVHVE